tara:strand:- start:1038 stop:1259 length:222 start_codon:yes stop_codon:yes gene_type:complete
MYACICKAVKSTEIKELIDSGANSLEKIGARCGAGTDCGSCVNRLKKALIESEAQKIQELPVPIAFPIKREAG